MADHETARRPVGERVTALETSLPELVRRIEEMNNKFDRQNTKLDQQSEDMRLMTLALERRSWSMRIAGWLSDMLKMAIAAMAGGGAVHFLSPHGGG